MVLRHNEGMDHEQPFEEYLEVAKAVRRIGRRSTLAADFKRVSSLAQEMANGMGHPDVNDACARFVLAVAKDMRALLRDAAQVPKLRKHLRLPAKKKAKRA